MLALHRCSLEGLLALLHVGGEILGSMQLVGLRRVCVRMSLRNRGFEHEVPDIVCLLQPFHVTGVGDVFSLCGFFPFFVYKGSILH